MKKIFILSRETSVTQTLSKFLSMNSFVTHVSNDLEKARSLMEKKTFDLIIMDLSFKKNCQELSRFNHLISQLNLPTIFLCDIPTKGNFLRGIHLKTQEFLIKPFRPIELINALHTLV